MRDGMSMTPTGRRAGELRLRRTDRQTGRDGVTVQAIALKAAGVDAAVVAERLAHFAQQHRRAQPAAPRASAAASFLLSGSKKPGLQRTARELMSREGLDLLEVISEVTTRVSRIGGIDLAEPEQVTIWQDEWLKGEQHTLMRRSLIDDWIGVALTCPGSRIRTGRSRIGTSWIPGNNRRCSHGSGRATSSGNGNSLISSDTSKEETERDGSRGLRPLPARSWCGAQGEGA